MMNESNQLLIGVNFFFTKNDFFLENDGTKQWKQILRIFCENQCWNSYCSLWQKSTIKWDKTFSFPFLSKFYFQLKQGKTKKSLTLKTRKKKQVMKKVKFFLIKFSKNCSWNGELTSWLNKKFFFFLCILNLRFTFYWIHLALQKMIITFFLFLSRL